MPLMVRRALRHGEQHHSAIGGQSPAVEAAASFLRPTAGKPNGSVVSSSMACVARSDCDSGWLRTAGRRGSDSSRPLTSKIFAERESLLCTNNLVVGEKM